MNAKWSMRTAIALISSRRYRLCVPRCARWRRRSARSESFTRAAEELCVTQGAVSHQVKALEVTLGIKLFSRERQRLVITDAGREYLNVIRDALDRIAVGTERILQRQNSGVLTVSTSPDFAAKWLDNLLGRFGEAHPGIDLRISATMHHIDFVVRRLTLQSGTATAIGAGLMPFGYAPS